MTVKYVHMPYLLHIYVHIYIQYTSKRTKHKLKLIMPRFDKKCVALLWFPLDLGVKRIVAFFFVNVPLFMGKVP